MSDTTQAPPQTGTFCWRECISTDAPASLAFYKGLFGWETDEMDMGPMGTYHMFKVGDQHVGGLMQKPAEIPDEVPSNWFCYVAVDDVDASTAKAESLGATVCQPPTDIPNVGRFSMLKSPTGEAIALFKGAAG